MSDATNQLKGETMAARIQEIRFKQDKNGKRIAQVWNWGTMSFVKIGIAKAELLIATDMAEESHSKW